MNAEKKASTTAEIDLVNKYKAYISKRFGKLLKKMKADTGKEDWLVGAFFYFFLNHSHG